LTEVLWTGQVIAETVVLRGQPTPGVIPAHPHGQQLLQEILMAEAKEKDNNLISKGCLSNETAFFIDFF